MPKLKVIVCRVGQPPVIEEMEPGLSNMQGLVGGGYIELVRLADDVDLYCDEEGLLKSLKPNRLVRNDLAIHGDFFLVSHDDEGETVGLTEAQLITWLAKAKSWPVALVF